MADGTLKVGTITNSAGSGNITIGSGVTLLSNTPAFEAEVSSTLTLTSGVDTLAPFDTEIFDTDSMYDNSASNYKFTPTVAGKYFVYARVFLNTIGTFTGKRFRVFIYKNGSLYANSSQQWDANICSEFTPTVSSVIDMNGSTDYLQTYVYMNVSSGTPRIYQDTGRNAFGAYRIGA
tara:strand:- start:17 stop:547 length:531 start_codon:yes stop_codon:yes gene_type:complete